MKAHPKIRTAPGHLICPGCMELLAREDIEGFGRCPYCDHRLQPSDDLEDFLLTPVVEQWIQHARRETQQGEAGGG